jgi:integrase
MATIRKVKKRDPTDPTGKRRTNTGRWEAIVYLGKHPDTGKERKQSRTFATRKDAEEWATKIEGLRNEGKYRPTVSKATLADWLRDTWLPMYRTQVRSTYTVEKVLGKWLFRGQPNTPLLGSKRLSRLTVSDFNQFYVALAEAHGMEYRGIQHLHGLLRRALKHAVRTGELPSNPTDFATLPKPDVSAEITCEADEDDAGEVAYLSPEQAKRFHAAARQDRFGALWLLLLDAGLRPGEAFALQWRHVDFERRLVKVRSTLARLHGAQRKERGQGWIITKPKTKASIGDVPVRKETIEALRRWKVEQNKLRLQLGSEWQDHGFVFTTEGGSPLGNNMGRAWARVLAAADGGCGDLGTWGLEPEKPRRGPTALRAFTPRFSPYVLRHTCATVLLLLGVDLLTVSRRLRHKNITITARFYGHVKAKDTTAAPEAFDQLFAASDA